MLSDCQLSVNTLSSMQAGGYYPRLDAIFKIADYMESILFLIPSSAHSGMTDANGGHYERGEYHYHHGYPAHQHVDVECPYDFVVMTEKNSNGDIAPLEAAQANVSGSLIQKHSPTPLLEDP